MLLDTIDDAIAGYETDPLEDMLLRSEVIGGVAVVAPSHAALAAHPDGPDAQAVMDLFRRQLRGLAQRPFSRVERQVRESRVRAVAFDDARVLMTRREHVRVVLIALDGQDRWVWRLMLEDDGAVSDVIEDVDALLDRVWL